MMDDWNRCGCEAGMAGKKFSYDEGSTLVQGRRSQGRIREMTVVREVIRVLPNPLFNSNGNERNTQRLTILLLNFRINGQSYPNGKKNLIPSIHN
jgi:hypothetical protein